MATGLKTRAAKKTAAKAKTAASTVGKATVKKAAAKGKTIARGKTTTMRGKTTAAKALAKPAANPMVAKRTLTGGEMKMMGRPVRDRIKHARSAARLTQQKLADLVGCDRVHVVHWEAGTYRPSLRYRRGLAKATGYPVSFFAHDGPNGQID